MGRLFKYLAWLIGALIALFVVAAVAFYLFFDANDFRENISLAVKEKTGRDLVIEGEISLDLFPWLAVGVGKASLGDAAGFGDEPIASIEGAKFSVRLLPVLLRQEIIVGAADLDSLTLNLKVDNSGRSNWSDLIPEDGDDASDAAASTDSEIDINRIDIENATIAYSNAQSGEVWLLDRVNLHVGRLASDGKPVPLTGDLHFDLQPTGMSGDIEVAMTMALDSENAAMTFNGVAVDGSIEGVAAIATAMKFSTDQIKIETGAYQVAMQPIDMEMLGITIRADVQPFSYEDRVQPKGTVAIESFSPRNIMTLFDAEPPTTADPEALRSVTMDATLQLTTTAIELTKVSVKMDGTTFSGTLSVPRLPNGTYQFDLVGDSIDLSRYMEPADEDGNGGNAEGAATEIPTDLIRPLNVRGSLKLETATLGDMIFEKVDLGLNTKAGRLRIFPLSAKLFGGSYNGDVNVDATGKVPALSVNEKVAGVNMANLAKAMFKQDNVTGTLEGAFQLKGRGGDTDSIKRSLAGNMSFVLKDGTYEGTDIWYEIRNARARLKGEEPPEPTLPPTTKFSTVSATGKVTEGVMQSDDLFAELPFMQITGSGQVDLAAATVNYGMTARILERPEFLPGATPEELNEYTEAVIPLKITGPLTDPKVSPDVQRLLRQRVEEEIKDKLEDKLKDLFNR